MNIIISHPIAIAIHRYFTNYTDRYDRKTFIMLMMPLSLLLIAVYGLGTDFKTIETMQVDLNKEVANIGSVHDLTPEKALKHLMTDEEFTENFSQKLSDSIPSMFWVCLTMLLSIPAIIKRTNDTFIHRNHSYPVVIYYVLYFFGGLTGIYFNVFMIYSALGIYSSIFVLLISFIPSKDDNEDDEEI